MSMLPWRLSCCSFRSRKACLGLFQKGGVHAQTAGETPAQVNEKNQTMQSLSHLTPRANSRAVLGRQTPQGKL